MPELPEVETIKRDLNKRVVGKTIVGVWSDAPKLIKRPKNFLQFKKGIIGKKIEKVQRRAKNVLFYLSGGKIMLAHQKMTGHFLYGNWEKKENLWKSKVKGPLDDPMNRFVHLIFYLDNKKQLALSDMRKFAKIELWKEKDLLNNKEFNKIGPEPLDRSFSLKKFKKIISEEKGKIKQVLMDQTVIAGIGNIYSDEVLWRAKINPLRKIADLSEEDLGNIYFAIIDVLKKSIKLRGESFSDFRDLQGEKGKFDVERKVYKREKELCERCKTPIKRMKVGGRSAHFCPKCQKV